MMRYGQSLTRIFGITPGDCVEEDHPERSFIAAFGIEIEMRLELSARTLRKILVNGRS